MPTFWPGEIYDEVADEDTSRAFVNLLRHDKLTGRGGAEQLQDLPSSGYLPVETISFLFGLSEGYVVMVARAPYDEEKAAYRFDLTKELDHIRAAAKNSRITRDEQGDEQDYEDYEQDFA